MGKVKNTTPKAKKAEGELTESGKKLKQARLPFKILEPSPKAAAAPADAVQVKKVDGTEKEKQNSQEMRKRKLSFVESEVTEAAKEDTGCKENLNAAVSKKTKTVDGESKVDEVITLDDSDVEIEEKNDKSEENASVDSPKTPQLKGKQRKTHGAGTPASGSKEKVKDGSSTSKFEIKLPLKKKRTKSLRKSTNAEQSPKKEKNEEETLNIESSTDDEVTEKVNPPKRVRTEESSKQEDKNADVPEVIKLDDSENLELQKEDDKNVDVTEVIKLDESEQLELEEEKKSGTSEKCEAQIDTDAPKTEVKKSRKSPLKPNKKPTADLEKESDASLAVNKPEEVQANDVGTESAVADTKRVETTPTKEDKAVSPKVTKESITKAKETSVEKNLLESEADSLKSTPVKSGKISTDADEKPTTDLETNNESDEEKSDQMENSSSSAVEIVNNATKIDGAKDTASLKKGGKSESLNAIRKKTPKQLKLYEQRRQAREEKERKLQEERLQKQREKDEKEQERKKQREEKEQQRRKERDEREEAKRKEREDKERKRLAELEAKNEEKRKKNEAKEEELRKKEEERKRKEQEKEELEMRKKKEAAAFSKFFVPKSRRSTTDTTQEQRAREGGEGEASETLAFQPFQVKGDMKMAPVCRKILNTEERSNLDAYLQHENMTDQEQLYLTQLRAGKITPGKWRRTSIDVKEDDSDDVVIVEDELERAGQAIVEEIHAPLERLRVKFYRFAENRRPPYYGTWRKRTEVITPRKPFALDKKYFDYEVDSDEEWEEEEPGESLDGSDDGREKESEDDDYEVDEWLVPHGHLSDEELQNNEDECAGGALEDDDTREAQKAKLKILQQEFAQEMKKKTEKIKPRLIGCIWVDENGNQPELCPKIIWDTLNMRAMLYTAAPLVEEPEAPEKAEPNSPSSNNADKISDKIKPIVLTDEMLKDLVRLVHGNRHSKQFLINEYIAYIEARESAIKNGDVKAPFKSVVREKIDEYADWKAIEVDVHNKKKRKLKKVLCWMVNDEALNKMNLQSLNLRNKWQYTLQPKFVDADNEQQQAELNQSVAETDGEIEATNVTDTPKNVKKKAKLEITNFTKVLTAEEREAQKLASSPSSSAKPKQPASKSSTTPIAKKRINLLASGPLGEKLTITGNSAQQPVVAEKETNASTEPDKPATPAKPKKRVALLASGPLGQKLAAPAKNASISQFLKKTTKEAAEKNKMEEQLDKKELKAQEGKSKLVAEAKHADPIDVDDIEDDVILLD